MLYRWHEFQRLADERKQALESALNLQNYHLECNELQSWMKEKTKVIESTQGLGNDLAGVMALQRKLTGMERDLEAIQVQCSTAHMLRHVEALSKPRALVATHIPHTHVYTCGGSEAC